MTKLPIFLVFLIGYVLNNQQSDATKPIECGVPTTMPNLTIFDVTGDQNDSDRIIGGTPARTNSWPWQAFLVMESPSEGRLGFCSGSIIAPRWLITAAHCVNRDRLRVTAHIGIHNRRKENNPYKVVEIIRHSLFDPDNKHNDIALLKLEKTLQYGDTIKPICLPDKIDRLKPGKEAIATGWGVNYQGPKGKIQTPDALFQVKLPIRARENCKMFDEIDTKLQVCGGDPNLSDPKDTCFGDSGGPLVMQVNKKLKFEIVGLTSFGGPVCNGNGVYTRVFNYKSWIQEVMANF